MRSDGVIVAGHGRLAAAHKLGLEVVPVVVLDHLSSTQRRALVIADNRIAENAGWDDAMLRIELQSLQEEGFNLDITGFDADALAEIMAGEETTVDGQTNDDAVPEVPVTPISRPGDVWELGNHRLVCGDSTDPKVYDALMADSKADMVFCDPPYGVNYANSAKDKLRGTHRPILNDNLGEDFEPFLTAALTPMLQRCSGAVYIAMSSSELDALQSAFRAAGGKWSTFIIWAKNTFTLGRADYQRQYEPILYGWPEGQNRHWCGDRDQGDVWNIKKPQKNDLHPTMKPVELVERAIRNSSRPGDIVLDPFGGAGTTGDNVTGSGSGLARIDGVYYNSPSFGGLTVDVTYAPKGTQLTGTTVNEASPHIVFTVSVIVIVTSAVCWTFARAFIFRTGNIGAGLNTVCHFI